MSRMSTLGTVLVTASLLSATLVGGAASADEITEPTSDVVIESTPTAEETAAPDAPADVPADETLPADAKPAPAPAVEHPTGTAELAQSPANDNYADAGIVEGPTFNTFVNNTNGATQSGEKVYFDEYSSFRTWNTVWVKWKAPATGAVTVDTFDSVVPDTGLAVFTGSKLSTAKRVAVNDDSANGESRSRITSLAVKSGTWYYFQLGGSGQIESQVTTGIIALNLVGNYNAPSNDNQANAKSMTGSSWNISGSTIGSSIETQWEPTSALVPGGQKRVNSIWYKWTAPAVGTIDLDTVGSVSNGAYVNAYASNPSMNIGLIAGGSDVDGPSHNATLNDMPVTAGTTYFFQVGDLTPNTSTIPLHFKATYTGPSITKLSVTSGKLKGGNYVTITGARLTNVDNVKFGGNSVLSIKHVSSTKIVVKVAQAYSKGKVAVLALVGSTRSRVVTASHYTFK